MFVGVFVLFGSDCLVGLRDLLGLTDGYCFVVRGLWFGVIINSVVFIGSLVFDSGGSLFVVVALVLSFCLGLLVCLTVA